MPLSDMEIGPLILSDSRMQPAMQQSKIPNLRGCALIARGMRFPLTGYPLFHGFSSTRAWFGVQTAVSKSLESKLPWFTGCLNIQTDYVCSICFSPCSYNMAVPLSLLVRRIMTQSVEGGSENGTLAMTCASIAGRTCLINTGSCRRASSPGICCAFYCLSNPII